MFSDEEVKQCETPNVGSDVVRAIMAKAAELLAARGGTLTAEDLREALSKIDALRMPDDWPHDYTAYVADHISALGARNAVLEAEVKRLSECAAVTETMAARRELDEARRLLATRVEASRLDEADDEIRNLRERLSAAEEGNRDLVRRAQQAEAQRDAHRSQAREWERLRNEAYRDFRAAADERDELKARCAALSAAGQVLSEHVDKARAVCERLFYWLAMGDEGPESELPCPEEIAELPKPIAELLEEARVAARGLGGLKDEDENHARYPCSPTCTHGDAAKPGHPERVRERSEAVKALSEKILPGPDVIDGGPGSRGPVRVVSNGARDMADAYAEGAEAMRAACLNVVQFEMEKRGASREEWEAMKSAIEGATP